MSPKQGTEKAREPDMDVQKPSHAIGKWVAGISLTCTTAATIYGAFAGNAAAAVLGFMGMAFAIVLLAIIAKAALQVGAKNIAFYDLMVKIVITFIVSYFIVLSCALFPTLTTWLKKAFIGYHNQGAENSALPDRPAVVVTLERGQKVDLHPFNAFAALDGSTTNVKGGMVKLYFYLPWDSHTKLNLHPENLHKENPVECNLPLNQKRVIQLNPSRIVVLLKDPSYPGGDTNSLEDVVLQAWPSL